MATSERVRRQRAYADRVYWEREQDRASMDPRAPLASKMWRNKKDLLPDDRRGACSPLGGQAKPQPKRVEGRDDWKRKA